MSDLNLEDVYKDHGDLVENNSVENWSSFESESLTSTNLSNEVADLNKKILFQEIDYNELCKTHSAEQEAHSNSRKKLEIAELTLNNHTQVLR